MAAREGLIRAISLLVQDGVQLMEWGDQVMKSFGYPAVPIIYTYAVPDASIDIASTLLHKAGFPRVEPGLGLQIMGKFGTEGALFALQDDQSASPLRLHMLPESLAHLNAEDADTTSSSIKPDLRILRPRLPEYCVSLIRCLEDYPLGSEDRLQPERYLSILLAVGAYKETYFDKIYELEEETESDEQFEIRRASALEVIESWTMREEIEAYRVKLKDVMFSTPSGHPAEARRHNDDWEAKL